MDTFTQILVCLGAIALIAIVLFVLCAVFALAAVKFGCSGAPSEDVDCEIDRAYKGWLDTKPVVTPREAFEAGARYYDYL